MSTSRPEIPRAGGQRQNWSELPGSIVEEIEVFLGDQIISATTLPGGFSPGIAARLTTSSGQHRFVKAVSSEVNADAVRFHRREIRVCTGLNAIPELPVPSLLWSFDAEDSPWTVLMFEHINGRQPAEPWVDAELDRCVDALNDLASKLAPTPLSLPVVEPVRIEGASGTNPWPSLRCRLGSVSDQQILQLADLCADVPAALQGNSLLHSDLRADNMLLGDDGQVYTVDWPHASIGASWVDPLCMVPSVEMQGGPSAGELFDRFDAARDADDDAVTTVLAAIAGYFVSYSLEPEIPSLPGLRAFQAAQGAVSMRWLGQRLGWT
ncbi:MAG: aminoglycoside phosphotransferase family protein [Thermomicrobiales bacterium]